MTVVAGLGLGLDLARANLVGAAEAGSLVLVGVEDRRLAGEAVRAARWNRPPAPSFTTLSPLALCNSSSSSKATDRTAAMHSCCAALRCPAGQPWPLPTVLGACDGARAALRAFPFAAVDGIPRRESIVVDARPSATSEIGS